MEKGIIKTGKLTEKELVMLYGSDAQKNPMKKMDVLEVIIKMLYLKKYPDIVILKI